MIEELTKEKDFNICLAFDYKFKKVFGENDGIRRLETLISLYFNIPYKEVKGKIKILNTERMIDYKNQKRMMSDVYLRLELINGSVRIDIEVSNKKLSQSIIDRNMIYGVQSLTTQLKKGQNYNKLEKTIVIFFDRGLEKIKQEEIKDVYTLRDKNGRELTNKLQIEHVDIEKCYEIWYSKNIEKYKEEENIIKLGALLATTNKREFEECLGGIPMEEEVREEISNINEELNDDRDIASWYDYEKDRQAMEEGRIADAVADAVEEAKEEAKEEGRNEGIIETASNFKKMNVDIETISKATGLSIEEIEKL